MARPHSDEYEEEIDEFGEEDEFEDEYELEEIEAEGEELIGGDLLGGRPQESLESAEVVLNIAQLPVALAWQRMGRSEKWRAD
jgi:hypothetical protein